LQTELEQETKPSARTTPMNYTDHGVFALNIGDFTQARVFFGEGACGCILTSRTCSTRWRRTHAQTGSHEEALNYLKRSIQIQPRFGRRRTRR